MQIIANKYGAILEDKKTDRSSSANKENAWQNIEREFNASSTTTTYRSGTSLKKCYENRKKELRKTVAEEYKQTMLTGGGPLPKMKKDETDDLLMSIINKKTLVGLENPFDDDVEVAVIQANKDINSDIVFEYVMEVDDETQNLSSSSTSKSTLIDQCDNQALPEKKQVSDSDFEVLAKDKFEDHNHISWKKITPKQLQIPISTPLAYPVKDSSEKDKETPKTNNNRRRPTTIIKPMTSSDVAKKYDMLLDKRSKLIDMQLKHMEEEHQLLMRKRSLEVEILQLELKNKKIEQL